MRRFSWLMGLLCLGGMAAAVSADTWCYANHPNAIFCDDFDRYCLDTPPFPQECPEGASPSIGSLRQVWVPPFDDCGSWLSFDETFIDSSPFSARYPCQGDSQLGRQTVSLISYIQQAFGVQYGEVLATDVTPLIFEFTMDGQTFGKINHANAYLELTRYGLEVTTDYVLHENCLSYCQPISAPDIQYPIICQQNDPPDGCASIETARHYESIAVGALAFLDKNPCHCNEPTGQAPTNDHLVFFDGLQWWTLEAGLFPGGGSNGYPVGDFKLRDRRNIVKITITTSMVKVELTCPDVSPPEYSWCDIPRDYTGGFSELHLGYAKGCELKPNSWSCEDRDRCPRGAPGAGAPCFDNVALYGGQGYTQLGACCFPDTTCVRVTESDCQAIGGTFQGILTSCTNTPCCPPLFADRDMDDDVDLDDFGWFQTCLSGPDAPPPNLMCNCADVNADGHVDQGDLLSFLACMTGADIPADPNCAN